MPKDGRSATEPYRVRTGSTWYWVDPTMPRERIEPGDTVVLYPAGGEAVVAVLRRSGESFAFSSLAGERFDVAADDISAMHLAAADEED